MHAMFMISLLIWNENVLKWKVAYTIISQKSIAQNAKVCKRESKKECESSDFFQQYGIAELLLFESTWYLQHDTRAF